MVEEIASRRCCSIGVFCYYTAQQNMPVLFQWFCGIMKFPVPSHSSIATSYVWRCVYTRIRVHAIISASMDLTASDDDESDGGAVVSSAQFSHRGIHARMNDVQLCNLALLRALHNHVLAHLTFLYQRAQGICAPIDPQKCIPIRTHAKQTHAPVIASTILSVHDWHRARQGRRVQRRLLCRVCS